MGFNAADQEEVEHLKKWWNENGKSIVGGLVIGVALLGGWNGWNSYINEQGMEASRYFERTQGALIDENREDAEGAAAVLMSDYPSTIYAANGVLGLAALKIKQGDNAAARANFQWVIENSGFEAPRQLAELGIARLYLDEGDVEGALNRILAAQSGTDGVYGSHYSEVKGDALRQQGDSAAAQVAYVEALQLADINDERRSLIEMKLAEVTQ
ncbi:MAG: tetratricopeptide repeat protein [Thiotrichales bacterium]|jgi:predicted negative regulator of RcsB-dependent stress response|nr:tetratricopeptide repeat protein [Thiotrichales bacterium]MBT3612899.1 tetratricopeptide repeat protein [Thiotrichales bacterium]MBT3752330.1 tetratricopeptide repeat protein [Thiotrichales bacterium]MBT3837082.1 tetratricopeptide repeat protein [Thiotrichales bacterium]MBT4152501.1 tetratricopeptide repeat protein [Thiotrichales bacterium]